MSRPSRPASRGYYPYDYGYELPQGGTEGYADYDDDWDRVRPVRFFTPVRLLLFLLVLVSAAAALYGLFLDRTLLQMPITVSGLAVLGLALVILAFSSAGAAATLGRRGFGGRALLAAFFGGLCALGAAGSLSGAIILGLLAASA